MGDVIELLGLSRTDIAAAKADAVADKLANTAKRPKGLSKEVFNLLEPHDIAKLQTEDDSHTKMVFRELAKKKVSKWRWKPFKNSARIDNLQLSHWEVTKPKVESVIENQDSEAMEGIEEKIEEKPYNFAQFNRSVVNLKYSEAEFVAAFEKTGGSGWSAEETKFLLYLCEKYELSWFVIGDRWTDVDEFRFFKSNFNLNASKENAEDISQPPEKDIVQLKSRFFSFMKQIFLKADAGTTTTAEQKTEQNDIYQRLKRKCTPSKKSEGLLRNFVLTAELDPIGEALRIEYLDKYQRRNADEVREENEVVDEVNEIDKQIEALKKEISSLKQVRGLDDELSIEYIKKHPSLVDYYMSSDAAGAAPLASAYKVKKFMPRTGVHFRSSRLVCPPSEIAIGPKLVEKVTKILDEIGVPRRIVATEKVATEYNGLRLNVLKLIVLHKELARWKSKN